MGVTNGRVEEMQEGNKGVSLERRVGRSNVQAEKQARTKWLPSRCTRNYFRQPKDDKKEGNGRWERHAHAHTHTRKHTHNYGVAVISRSV